MFLHIQCNTNLKLVFLCLGLLKGLQSTACFCPMSSPHNTKDNWQVAIYETIFVTRSAKMGLIAFSVAFTWQPVT